jgi:alanyl-tRNA synthetase
MSSYETLSETQQFACHVIADHARATAFSIADGIVPGNEGRNYVLRKIMRRAIYHGREHLGLKDLFFYKVCDFAIDRMREAYPELETHREFIGKMVKLEEERFGSTMTVGLSKLGELDLAALTSDESRLFTEVARLYDTYGTPRDLIRVYLEEKETVFEEEDFNARFDSALQALQQQSGIGKTERKSEISPVYAKLLESTGANKFLGYETTQVEDAKVVALFKGDEQIDEIKTGEQGGVVLDQTPFYAESGGQVGDTGKVASSDFAAKVNDTYSPVSGLIVHKVTVEQGAIKVGNEVVATVDAQKRDATRRNHTATHLVHAALKEVLGSHVKQAGSVVAPNYLRFDFSHYQPMSASEIQEVEDLVNRYVLENHPVTTTMMSIEDAMRSGAVAMFGEKYGAEVRVLSVGGGEFSKELCGGTHVRATGDIGSFKITSDEAIASGVRRIRAITGFDAFERFREDELLIDRSLEALKTQRDNLPYAIERLQDELKRTRKEIDDLKLKIATGAIGGASSNGDEGRDVSGVKVLAKIVDDLDANGARQLSDTLLARLKSGVVILGRADEGKASLIVRVSGDLTDKVKAGNLIKELVPILGGKGGGRPDMAEGGGPESNKLSQAIDASYGIIEKTLTS